MNNTEKLYIVFKKNELIQHLYHPCKAFFVCYYHIVCACVAVDDEKAFVVFASGYYADVYPPLKAILQKKGGVIHYIIQATNNLPQENTIH